MKGRKAGPTALPFLHQEGQAAGALLKPSTCAENTIRHDKKQLHLLNIKGRIITTIAILIIRRKNNLNRFA
jgi:hypothetical protein